MIRMNSGMEGLERREDRERFGIGCWYTIVHVWLQSLQLVHLLSRENFSCGVDEEAAGVP